MSSDRLVKLLLMLSSPYSEITTAAKAIGTLLERDGRDWQWLAQCVAECPHRVAGLKAKPQAAAGWDDLDAADIATVIGPIALLLPEPVEKTSFATWNSGTARPPPSRTASAAIAARLGGGHDDDPMLVRRSHMPRKGLPVFPVSAAKIPFKGSAGHKDASTDPDRIHAMWHAHPGAMIAVATGDRCGYCVLDVDTKEAHGADGRATAKKLGLSFAGGVVALTPSGGWHVWFKTGGQALPSKNGLIGPGLDFKADGGYAVLPPSRPDPKKGGYQWVNGSDLSAAAEVPAEIVAALKRTPHERDFLEACEPIRNASSAPGGPCSMPPPSSSRSRSSAASSTKSSIATA